MDEKMLLNGEDFEDMCVTLTDDEGNEADFELLDVIEYRDIHYVVLFPLDEEDDEYVILQFEEGEDEITYIDVEDDTIVQAVFEIFQEKHKDEFED